MPAYTTITIIYNPNSTGSSESLAKQTAKKLGRHVDCVATEYAGHAEVIARELASDSTRPLIISASGDGGYHEVVNGILQSQNTNAVAGLLPAGNANDHHRNITNNSFIDDVRSQTEQRVDILTCSARVKGKAFERFAHSYIGFGLTPQAGKELNKTSLNSLREKWIVLRSILGVRPVRLHVNGRIQAFDSLICSNIADMSKVLSLSNIAKPDDGKFEITALYSRNRFRLVRALAKAVTIGLQGDTQATSLELQTTRPTLVQLDGEIQTFDARSRVAIGIKKQALRCIV